MANYWQDVEAIETQEEEESSSYSVEIPLRVIWSMPGMTETLRQALEQHLDSRNNER